MSARALLDSPAAASVVAGVLSVVLSLLGLDGPRWDARFAPRLDERERLQLLLRTHYLGRPGKDLYGFVPDLALRRPMAGRARRLAERLRLAEALPPGRYEQGCSLARQWLATVGEFARAAAVEEELPLRQFLQTYHLGVLREGLVALPFVMSLHHRDALSDAERDQAAWGLALIEAAARYNSLAPHQRQAVYFLDSAGLGPAGPIVRPPPRWLGPALTARNRLQPGLRLRQLRHRVLAERRLRRVPSRLSAGEADGPGPAGAGDAATGPLPSPPA